MSKYTSIEVACEADLQEDHVADMLRDYATILYHREAAKAGVTDRCPHGIRYPHPCRECEDGAPMHDGLYRAALEVSGRIHRWRTEGTQPSYREWMEIEERIDKAISSYVAPMLSARVPDAMCGTNAPSWVQKLSDPATYAAGWNACRNAMLAAAPKPETKE